MEQGACNRAQRAEIILSIKIRNRNSPGQAMECDGVV